MSSITLQEIKVNEEVKTYLKKADKYLEAIGYTEHGERHAYIVSKWAKNILTQLDYSQREAELAAIAGYLHDIGNVVSRNTHGQSGALITHSILKKMNMDEEEIIDIMAAIGTHEEEQTESVNYIASSLIIADKSDVHQTRVRNLRMIKFDIHDRVNYAVKESFLEIKKNLIILTLTIDTEISQVMEYFEIFLSRMLFCKKAARFLKTEFEIVINGMRLL